MGQEAARLRAVSARPVTASQQALGYYPCARAWRLSHSGPYRGPGWQAWAEGRSAPEYHLLPACAGEPEQSCPPPEPAGVYPRVCGGTTMSPKISPSRDGLSPRVRGNHQLRPGTGVSYRSIPACAGEPAGQPYNGCGRRVYPRVCGGTGGHRHRALAGGGLSPRVRGNHFGSRAGPGPGGSIPACAGEPGRVSQSPVGRGVYPRVCGGTSWPR